MGRTNSVPFPAPTASRATLPPPQPIQSEPRILPLGVKRPESELYHPTPWGDAVPPPLARLLPSTGKTLLIGRYKCHTARANMRASRSCGRRWFVWHDNTVSLRYKYPAFRRTVLSPSSESNWWIGVTDPENGLQSFETSGPQRYVPEHSNIHHM